MSRAERELAHGDWPSTALDGGDRRIKIAGTVVVGTERVETPAGVLRAIVRRRDEAIEELILDGIPS